MNKKFLRKVLEIVFWLVIMYLGVLLLLFLSLNAFVTSFLIITYIAFIVFLKAWLIPKCIIGCAKMKFRKSFHLMYEQYQKALEDLYKVHKYRYKLYFSSDKTEEIQKLTNAISSNGKKLIDACNRILAKGYLNKKQNKLLQEIVDEITYLMENESVNSNVKKSSS